MYSPAATTHRRPRRLLAGAALAILCMVSTALYPLSAQAAQGDVSTFAGGPGQGPATAVGQDPVSLAVAGGRTYVADYYNSVVRTIDAATGAETVLAGNGTVGFSGDGGPGDRAQVSMPLDLAVDGDGNLFVADSNARIRRVAANTGVITTVAGTGAFYRSTGDGGPASQAELGPAGLAFDSAGNLFVADANAEGGRIRMIAPGADGLVTGAADETITTVAGTGDPGFGGDGGPAIDARLKLGQPSGLAVDGAGNLYLVDGQNWRVRFVNRGATPVTVYGVTVDPGHIATVAGGGPFSFSPTQGDGAAATQANLRNPADVALSGGNLYIADSANHRVRKVEVTGTITTVAGRPTRGFSGDSGPAAAAELARPLSVAFDGPAYLIADRDNYRVRRVDVAGIITTVAGNGSRRFSGDGGPAGQAAFDWPADVAFDSAGAAYVADLYNGRVRKVHPNGTVSTYAGNGSRGADASGNGGPATQAQLLSPEWVSVDTAGNLYVSEWGANRVRKVDTSGTITAYAGDGTAGYGGDGGQATAAQLNTPKGLALDRFGNLYIADSRNYRVRRVAAASGTITTVAGAGPCPPNQYGLCDQYGGDGGPATAALIDPSGGLGFDPAGSLYIADHSRRIRRVAAGADGAVTGAADETVTTVAGVGEGAWPPNGLGRSNYPDSFGGDGGPATQAKISPPQDVAFDPAGNLYLSDDSNQRVRRVLAGADGVVTGAGDETISTVGGSGPCTTSACEEGFGGDGGPATSARFFAPGGLSFDAAGNLFVADLLNHRIRRIEALGRSPLPRRAVADFDGSGSSDPAVYRPSAGAWYSQAGPAAAWGNDSDIPVPGHYDGDADADAAVYRPSTGAWYVQGGLATTWGNDTDVPVPGDYDGDGMTDVAVYRPSTGAWYVQGGLATSWGVPGDVPVPANYDDDPGTEVAVYRPSTGAWYVQGGVSISWGLPGDVPVPGDYDGDGSADVAVYRPSTGAWYVQGGATVQWGLGGDVPVPGDYNGDASADIAVYRPSTGAWYVRDQLALTWGIPGDIPLALPPAIRQAFFADTANT